MATYQETRLKDLLAERKRKEEEWINAAIAGRPEASPSENVTVPAFDQFRTARKLQHDLERRIAQGEFESYPYKTVPETETITETDTVSNVDDTAVETDTTSVVETKRDPFKMEITEGPPDRPVTGLTSFSDRLRQMNVGSIEDMFPYPVTDPAVVAQRKALQRQRDGMRALYQKGPKDITWSDNMTTSQMEDRWKRQRSAYMANLMQTARPRTRADVNALAGAAGLDQDEWTEMLTLFDASVPNVGRRKSQIEVSNLVEQGLLKQAAREWVTGIPLNVLRDDTLFGKELHMWQTLNPLASGKEFVEEVKAQRDLIYNKPKDAEMLVLTDPQNNSHLGYAKRDNNGIPRYYLSQTNEMVEITPGWTISSPMATKVDIKTGIEPTRAMKLNLAESSLRNALYAMERMVAPDGTLNFGFLDALAAEHNVPGTAGRTTRTIMGNAVGDALRIESGAAIPPDELLQMAERYMPLAGDTDEAKRYKIREFYERVSGLVKKSLPEWADANLPNPIWAPATIITEDEALALVPGSYFQTEAMKLEGVIGRTPSLKTTGWMSVDERKKAALEAAQN